MNRQFVGGIEPEKEDLGEAMIDPDDGVVMDSHDFSLCLNEGSLLRRNDVVEHHWVSATSAPEPSSIRRCPG
jgi:hypothetical protein